MTPIVFSIILAYLVVGITVTWQMSQTRFAGEPWLWTTLGWPVYLFSIIRDR